MSNEHALALQEQSGLSTDPRRNALAIDPFEPQSMEALYKFAECVAGTDFAPKDFKAKPEACFVAMVYGRSLGVGALQSIQNIAVINGKPSTYGDLYWALIISHPEFEDADENVTAEEATVTLKRRGRTPKTASFSMAEAVTAELSTKDPWKKYPKQMMLWRARHIAGSALFADALKGITPREVAIDYAATIEGDRSPEPRPFAAAQVTEKPAPATSGDQPKPASTPAAEDRTITEAELAEWNGERKKSGWNTDEGRMYITSLGLKRSGEMKLSQLPAAMVWAKTKAPSKDAAAKDAPAPATTGATKEEAAGFTPASSSAVESACRDAMNKGGLGMFEQNALVGRFTKDGVTDWGAVAEDLNQKGLVK